MSELQPQRDPQRQKEMRNDPIMRKAREITEWYKTNGVLSPQMKLIVNKLRGEYEEDMKKLNKKHAEELDPLIDEYDALTKEVVKRQIQIRKLGEKHEEEHKELSGKYVDMELTVLHKKYG